MKKNLLLGIDIGTSKVAVVIIDSDKQLHAVTSEPHLTGIDAGLYRSEQNPGQILKLVINQIKKLPTSLKKQVKAIGVTGQMHGIMFLDRNLYPVSNLITWQDRRCDEIPGFLEEIHQNTGYRLSNGFGFATLAWMNRTKQFPENYISCCTIHDYFVARISGLRRPVTDFSGAASWGFYNIETNIWDKNAIENCGIPLHILPEVLPCGFKAGNISASMASELGLNPGVPVASAIGDNQASLIATLDHPGRQLALTIGTGGQISVIINHFVQKIEKTAIPKFEYRPFINGKIALVAASLCGGSAWNWLADVILSMLKDIRKEAPSKDEIFKILNSAGMASKEKVTVFPHFMGERYDSSLKGSIHDLTLENFTLGTLAKGVAYGIISNLKDMLPEEEILNRTEIVASGNLFRRVPLILEATKEIFRMPVILIDSQEEAAIGAALNAEYLIEKAR